MGVVSSLGKGSQQDCGDGWLHRTKGIHFLQLLMAYSHSIYTIKIWFFIQQIQPWDGAIKIDFFSLNKINMQDQIKSRFTITNMQF